MADVSDPKIAEGYEIVRQDGDDREYDWIKIGYEEGSNAKIVFGNGGKEYSFVEQLADDEVCFVYVRVIAGDKESKRTKFVFVSWIGENVSVMRKARVSVHKSEVKNVFKDFAVEVQTSDKDDLDYDKVMDIVKKAGGAVYTKE